MNNSVPCARQSFCSNWDLEAESLKFISLPLPNDTFPSVWVLTTAFIVRGHVIAIVFFEVGKIFYPYNEVFELEHDDLLTSPLGNVDPHLLNYL